MAGLLSPYLGNNDAYKWLDQNRNSLAQGFAGITGATSFGDGAKGAAYGLLNGAQTDQANQKLAQSKIDDQAKIQKAADALRNQWNRPDLADAVINGGLGLQDAWNTALTSSQPPELTANQRDFQFAQQNPDYAAFLNPQNQQQPPENYRWSQDGSRYEAIPGGPADPANPLNANKTGQGPMSPTTQKELFEAEDAVTAGSYVLSGLDQALTLNEKAFDGPGADVRGAAGAAVGWQGAAETELLKNITTEMALNQLKATFGASPTEGERQILIDLQGSVNQPKNVRAQIYARAKELAQRRLDDNKRKAEALRSGQYFQPGYGGSTPMQSVPQPSGGGFQILSVE